MPNVEKRSIPAFERWLRDEVLPVYGAITADPSCAISLDDAFDAVRAIHAERVKTAR